MIHPIGPALGQLVEVLLGAAHFPGELTERCRTDLAQDTSLGGTGFIQTCPTRLPLRQTGLAHPFGERPGGDPVTLRNRLSALVGLKVCDQRRVKGGDGLLKD